MSVEQSVTRMIVIPGMRHAHFVTNILFILLVFHLKQIWLGAFME